MAYTKAQTEVLESFETISYEQAVRIGLDIGQSTASVIAKVKSLDIPYIKKAVAPKRPAGLTKAEIVTEITDGLSTSFDLSGLTKAPASALIRLLTAVNVMDANLTA